MPTVKDRYTFTATDHLQSLIDRAARVWPEDRDHPKRLLLRLMDEGGRVIQPEEDEVMQRKRAALDSMRGILEYPPNYLEELREGWPE